MVTVKPCPGCKAVDLPGCGATGHPYDAPCAHTRAQIVSLVRPTGRKALRRPGMPETLRLTAVSSQSQPIGEFLEWLAWEQGVVLAEWDSEAHIPLRPSTLSTEKLLARYFGIDLERVERERRRLLAWVQAKGNA